MAKGQSPLLGYNTNVRHKGRVFHIQTEDSGVSHPHVITHLFADGGRILKSNKTAYADLLDAPDLQPQVKKIMQDQHKAMFIALRDGQFDHLIDPAGATGAHAARESAVPVTTPSAAELDPDATVRTSVSPTTPAAPVRPPSAVPTPQQTGTRPVVPPPAPPAAAPVPRPAAPPLPRPSAAMPAVTAPAPTPTAPASAAPPSQKPAAPGSTPSPASGTGKYAPVRSPEILSSFKSRTDANSIFGDGMMSEKSLDEVILAYLAEDLDDTKKR